VQTIIHPQLKNDARAARADDILRSCVHCGFCISACPTYQLLGDELDSPRGRIYLIKNMLETDQVAEATATHLDRCLTCRSCETVCPSGVEYVELLDIAREMLVERKALSLKKRVKRWLLRKLLLKTWLVRCSRLLIRILDPILPKSLGTKAILTRGSFAARAPESKLPLIQEQASDIDAAVSVVLLKGCVQQSLTPEVNTALCRLLDEQGVSWQFLGNEGCCGALEYHLGEVDDGRSRMKALIDQLYPLLTDVDYIVSSASGCGVTLKHYADYFAGDPVYRQQAQAVCEKLVDVVELMEQFSWCSSAQRIWVHTPCTLGHGQGLDDRVGALLAKAGAEVITGKQDLACCGSAGTYSVLQPLLANELRGRMQQTWADSKPEFIVTSNVGCQLHLAVDSQVPVVHWLEYLRQHQV
jgi:glycolate oxidase iron-sulfur subunit